MRDEGEMGVRVGMGQWGWMRGTVTVWRWADAEGGGWGVR